MVTAARHDNNAGEVQFFPNRARDLETADFRQEEVADNRIGSFGESQLDPGFSFQRLNHIPAVPGE